MTKAQELLNDIVSLCEAIAEAQIAEMNGAYCPKSLVAGEKATLLKTLEKLFPE